jgi:hypothetical protein
LKVRCVPFGAHAEIEITERAGMAANILPSTARLSSSGAA